MKIMITISNVYDCNVVVGELTKCNFVLNGSASEKKGVYLIIKFKGDRENEAQRIIPFSVGIAFTADFDF